MKKKECAVCHREPEGGYETVILTENEKEIIRQSGFRPVPDSFLYCKACWKILSDAERGAQLMRGLGEMSLRLHGSGVEAEAKATKFHTALLKRARGKS